MRSLIHLIMLAISLAGMVSSARGQDGGTYRPEVIVIADGGAPCALDNRFLAQAISRQLALRQGRTPIHTKIYVRVRSTWRIDGCHDHLDIHYNTRRSRGSSAHEIFYTPHTNHLDHIAPLDARQDRYEAARDAAIELFDRTNRHLNLIPMN
ncbi:MAG: hypothetical protein P1U65_10495 [Minwuia sp.]|nr:hypothetical protein [Minwuia sp.]